MIGFKVETSELYAKLNLCILRYKSMVFIKFSRRAMALKMQRTSC